MSQLTALARGLPRVPDKAPPGLTVVATLDCGAGGYIGACQWGNGYMLVRVAREEGEWPDAPLTPLLSRDEIHVIAEGALTGDARVRTWPLLTAVLALGLLLADVPREPEADTVPVEPASPPPAAPGTEVPA